MKAFVGYSFSDEDTKIAHEFMDYFKSIGVTCFSGEKPQNRSINEQVKQEIDKCDVFIGIFTRDKKIVDEKNNEEYTTSNWVIQESGYAIGKEKELIFFVENSIYKFPELQGDLEVIYFDRDNIEKTSKKINYMIKGIKERNISSAGEKSDNLENLAEKNEEISTETPDSPFNKDSQEKAEVDDLIKEIDKAFNEKDYTKARLAYIKVEPLLEEDDKIPLKAHVLKWCHASGEAEAFNELLQLSKENKNNIAVLWNLACRYKEMGEYVKAKDIFLNISEIYDWKDEEKWEYIFLRHDEAVQCLIEAKKYKDAIELLFLMISKNEFKEYKSQILAKLANIYHEEKDFEKFFMYAEGSLDLDPLNTDLRFKLAYEYSLQSYDKLSLLHYLKLINTQENASGLNNIGVQYNKLELPAKNIEYLFKSANHKHTLAMANIADSYLDRGFIKDARKMIKKANDLSKEGITVHGNIGLAKNRLDTILDNENKKEANILKKADEEREFRVNYCEALYKRVDIENTKLFGVWNIHSIQLELKLDDNNKFEINEKIIEKNGKWIISKEDKIDEHRIIDIKGKITNLCGEYEIKIDKVGKYGTKTSILKAKGHMIISPDFKVINTLEKSDGNHEDIKKWELYSKIRNE